MMAPHIGGGPSRIIIPAQMRLGGMSAEKGSLGAPCNSPPHTHTLPYPLPPSLHRRDERKRAEEALAKVVSEHDAAIKRTAEEAKAEKEAMRRMYDKQLETLREQYETGQVGIAPLFDSPEGRQDRAVDRCPCMP